MYGYTEIIQVMGAMIIFSLILLSTNRYMLNNTQQQINTELETQAVSIGQNLIDEALLKPFDESTIDGVVPVEIPDSFVDPPFGQSNASSRDQIESFEGYNGWTEVIQTDWGELEIAVEVFYVDSSNWDEEAGYPTRHKKMVVTLDNESLGRTVSLSYIRTYNHD